LTNERADKLRHEVLREGFAHGHVGGDSMEPTLHLGETVRLEPCGLPRAGDVVAFASGGGLMIHRALCVRHGRALCRGDNRTAHDGWVPAGAIVGRAVAVFGPTRPDGDPVVNGMRGLCLATRHTAARSARFRGRRAAAEVRLLWRQARGLPLGDLEGRPDGHGLPAGVTAAVLSPEAALAAVAAGGEVAGVAPALAADHLAIPAGVYCRLRCDERQRLLLRHRGPHTVVYAYAAQGALVRLTSAARRALRRAGRVAGEPGDRVAPWPAAGPGLVRVFTAPGLEAELGAAMGARWVVQPAASAGSRQVPLWCATLRPGQGAQDARRKLLPPPRGACKLQG
jgi:hypothetical protein